MSSATFDNLLHGIATLVHHNATHGELRNGSLTLDILEFTLILHLMYTVNTFSLSESSPSSEVFIRTKNICEQTDVVFKLNT